MAQCIGKQWYDTQELAQRVADNYTKTNYQKRTFRPYVKPCTICGLWHITSKALRGRR